MSLIEDIKGMEFDKVIVEEVVSGDLPSHMQIEDVLKGKLCPYCYQRTEYVDSAEVYNGRSYGMLYICRPCKAWVGVHHKTSRRALGRLANDELRKAKMRAHEVFDRLWKFDRQKRSRCYAWLAKEMKIPEEHCHIGMMNLEQCEEVVAIVQLHYHQSV